MTGNLKYGTSSLCGGTSSATRLKNKSRVYGMTTFEFAMVILIISLTFGSIQFAQTLREKALAQKLASEMQHLVDAVYMYREKYKAVPGDDKDADLHLPGGIPSAFSGLSTNGGGNGLIHGSWTTYGDIAWESDKFWNHVRLAGLVPGNPFSSPPLNAVGGMIGVSSDRSAMPARPADIPGLYSVCSSTIPGQIARMVDQELDDGNAKTGTVWAGMEKGAPIRTNVAPTPYLDNETFTVCMAFQ
ncbi:hypothetical protein LE190_14350 [Massilia oculi]|uniref:Type II secretion system protein n=1 Tax=Massilia hydrophila TaxID=3044279 RepID=A0ABS7YBP4_9BURK|nr:hypothetical protein [Massilia oculi]MCA1857099.1 hypothetical protein [Massilia oculi]